jgi:ATP-dependent DNA helicase RecG
MIAADPQNVLRKVLLLERQQNFQNRAASGGLTRFSRHLADHNSRSSLLQNIATLLAHYDASGYEQRRWLVEQTLSLLDSKHSLTSHDFCVSDPDPSSAPPSQRERKTRVAHAGTESPLVHRGKEVLRSGSQLSRSSRPFSLANLTLDSPLSAIPRLRMDARAALMSAGVETVRDLLFYFPRDHYDYRDRRRISRLRYGEKTTLVGVINDVRLERTRRGLIITTAVVADDSGSIPVRWFNQPYLAKHLKPGRSIAITGEASLFNGYMVFVPRDYEWIDEGDLTHAGRLVPIYPLRRGLYQKSLRELIHRAVLDLAPKLVDYLPSTLRQELSLMSLGDAVAQYHFPDDEQIKERAQRRLAFDELFAIQLGLTMRKREWQDLAPGLPLQISDEAVAAFEASLPFTLTGAQRRAMAEIRHALMQPRPMSRLLQGDVGSGKTVVATFALFLANQAGSQGVLMAPTEILAEQHFETISAFLAPFGHRVELLVGSTPTKQRRELYAAAAEGALDVLVGTHTLIQEGIEFARLGVAVIDEQHRFGVEQRARLRQKGHNPHVLAMTATPIPRTLALTIYGDLDISVLDELPPGRQPVVTEWVSTPICAYSRVREEVRKGRQAFIICPVIEESADADMKSAIAEHKYLQSSVFPDLRVGLLHGRLKASEKDHILSAFRAGKYQILVATSVVEVGIDIPNATVMVIRDAHRFGLAQLHQFRGRIGRGAERSYCLLTSDVAEGAARERLAALLHMHDGFALAEEDLRLRGPGEFWGTRQSGLPELRVAKLGDVATIEIARVAAARIVADDPALSSPEHAALHAEVTRFWSRATDLS